MKKPLITVAVVCFNEEQQIAGCLQSLLSQTLAPQLFEILVVDNNSSDQTLEIIKKLQKKNARIRLVVNPKKGIAVSRNLALSLSKGKYLAFTDADCQVTRKWLEILYDGYRRLKAKDRQLVAVGGPNVPPKTTDFHRALGIMLNSFLGSRGSVQARHYTQDRWVPHLSTANVFYEKDWLKKIKGFDESLGSIIEDEDLSYRLARKNRHFYYLAKAVVVHDSASNFRAWAKKMFIYGQGRIKFLRRHPEKKHLFFLIPMILPIILPLYLPTILVYALLLSLKSKEPSLFGHVFWLFCLTHLAYGVGEMHELV